MRHFLLPAAMTALAGLPLDAARAQEATVTMAMHYTQEQAEPLLACIERYNQQTDGVTVEYRQISYRDYLQTVLTSRLGGQSADIYNVYSIWAAQMVDNGVLAEPPEDVAQFIRDTYVPATVEAATIQDTLWGVPTEVSVYMLVSNMELLREAGIEEPPTTWEAMVEAAAAVTQRNEQGRIDRAGFAFAESSTGAGVVHPFYAMLYSMGQDVYSDDYSEANLDSDAATEALSMQRRLIAEEITDRTVDGYDFPAGGIGMVIMANWYESAIREGIGEGFEDKIAVSQIPMGEDWKTLQYAFFMGVDSNSEAENESWEVVRFLNDPAQGQDGMSCVGQMLSGLGALTANTVDVDAMGEMDAFTRPFWEALQDGRAISQPNVMQASEIEGRMAATFDRVLAGEAEPGPALERLDTEVEDILFEFY